MAERMSCITEIIRHIIKKYHKKNYAYYSKNASYHRKNSFMTVYIQIATHPKIHQIEKLRFDDISQYKFKLRFWFDLNLYRLIRVSGFGGFRGLDTFRGNCHIFLRM